MAVLVPPRTLASLVLGPHARSEHGRVFADGRWYTRAEVRAAVSRCVEELRAHGVEPGRRVLALVDHDLSGVVFLTAASTLGLHLLLPYNLHAAASGEWCAIAEAARPDLVLCLRRDTGDLHLLRRTGVPVLDLSDVDLLSPDAGAPEPVLRPELTPPPVPTGPTERFLLLFTSGTTGAPKAVSVSEEQVVRRVLSVSAALGFDATSRVFMSGLLNNTIGVIFAFGALWHGADLVLPTGREVTGWPRQLAEHRATHVMLRPVALERFVEAATHHPVDLGSLRTVAYGAAAMPVAVLEAGRALMPCNWVQGYGLSETFGPFCWLDETGHRQQRYRGDRYCVGLPGPGTRIRIDPLPGHADGLGEVLVHTDAVMEGYLDVRTGRLTPPGTWLRTGDVGRWSEQGDLLLKGRLAGSLLSANGHRIYPEEVEAALAEVPGVREAVLVGVPAPGLPVDRPVACLSGPVAAGDPSAVRERVTRALGPVLSREKWPDLLYTTTAPFPRSANDKVRRGEVAALAASQPLIEL